MFQVRQQGGSDPRWFCPDRDLVYAVPKLIGTTLTTLFADKYDVAGISPEEFGAECAKLADIFRGCRDGSLSPDAVTAAYLDINGKVREVLAGGFFATMLGAFREWSAYVRPSDPGDAPPSVERVEEAVKAFAKKWCSRRDSEEGG